MQTYLTQLQIVRYTKGDLTWDLRQPSKLVECFYFLCSLKVQIDEDFDKDMEAMRARTGKDIVNWGVLETRTNNWDAYYAPQASSSASEGGSGSSQSAASEKGGKRKELDPQDVVPAKKRCHRDQAGCPGDERMEDNADKISTRNSRREDTRSVDEMSTSSDASSEPIVRDREETNRWYASIISWRAGKKYPVYDMEEFRNDTSIPMV